MWFYFIFIYLGISLAHGESHEFCGGLPTEQSCTGGKDIGHGKGWNCRPQARELMWWYDTERRDCRAQIYRGCGGNNNRYCTLHHCRKKCKS
nr:PI-stichotoxin-She2a-like [Drosophila bipectinata]